MDTPAGAAIRRASSNAYDNAVKNLLAQKPVLAWIMKDCVSEYKGLSAKEIEGYIEGTPEVGITPVHAKDDNPVIQGSRNEDNSASEKEQTVTYDVRFSASVPGGGNQSIGLYINVEAQNKYNPGYPLVMRGIYYCSRMLSAQYGRDFQNFDYGCLRKVYSIWICTNVPKYAQNTINQYTMHETNLVGSYCDRSRYYDLLNVTLIALGPATSQSTNAEKSALSLLRMILLEQMDTDTKLNTVKSEYGINTVEKEVTELCNLSESVWNAGHEEGRSEGLEEGRMEGRTEGLEIVAVNMLKRNYSAEDTASLSEVPLQRVLELNELIKQGKL